MSNTENCKAQAGQFTPVINRNRCEAKGDCVKICPYQVFAVQTVSADEKRLFSLRSKLKLWVHGGQQAYAIGADNCHGCGLCVSACPEKAITLQRQEC